MASESLDDIELSYIAGLIDADGSITISKQPQKGSVYYRPRLTIYNSHKPILEWVTGKLPVSVDQSVDRRIDERHSVESYSLSVTRLDDLKNVLVELIPHLKIKRKQAIVAVVHIEMIQNRDSHAYTDELKNKMASNREVMKLLNDFETDVDV